MGKCQYVVIMTIGDLVREGPRSGEIGPPRLEPLHTDSCTPGGRDGAAG